MNFKVKFLVILACLFSCTIFSQSILEKRHVEVSLRMIGHQILLHSGDSSSLVLPVVHKSNQYRLKFENDFVFEPNILVDVVSRVFKKNSIGKHYVVEVISCKEQLVVYSFEINDWEQQNVVPCQTRLAPKECYEIVFTLSEIKSLTDKKEELTTEKGGFFRIMIYLLLVLIVVLILVFYWLRKKKSSSEEFDLIGDLKFDRKNSMLIFKDIDSIILTGKESELLVVLYERLNEIVDRETILNLVWGDEGDYVGRTLDVFISRLRKKLESDSKIQLVNIRAVGYKLSVKQ